MDESLFSATPNKQNTDLLNKIVAETICQKLSSIIQQIGEQLDIDYSHEAERFNASITHNEIVNPYLFSYYFKLKEAVEDGNLDNILDLISILATQNVFINKNFSSMPLIESAINSEIEKSYVIQKARSDKISEFGTENNMEIIRPISYKERQQEIETIKKAIDTLFDSDREHHYSAVNNLNAIKIFNGTVRAFSYQCAYGNIYIRLPQAEDKHKLGYYLEHIIHECAHQNLFALQLIDPVVLNDPNHLYDAPIRKQKRPMNGVFHACFVLARLMRGFRKVKGYIEDQDRYFYPRLEEWFNKSYETVEQYAIFSEYGTNLFNSIKSCAYD